MGDNFCQTEQTCTHFQCLRRLIEPIHTSLEDIDSMMVPRAGIVAILTELKNRK